MPISKESRDQMAVSGFQKVKLNIKENALDIFLEFPIKERVHVLLDGGL